MTKMKKIISVFLAAVLICTAFTACSSEKAEDTPADATTKPAEVTDADDTVKVAADDEEETVLRIKDKSGNTLTLVPIYNTDGVTVIAGYVESAVDKNGKALGQKDFSCIKGVVALDIDSENNFSLRYTQDNKIETIKALSDENAYIIAMQDAEDIDKDKDTAEYFKVVTKLDANKNLFIKLDKDEKGNPINVTVEEKKNEKTGETAVTVTQSDGTKVSASVSTEAKNLADVVREEKKKQEEQKKSAQGTSDSDNNSGSKENNNSNNDEKNSNSKQESTTQPTTTQPAVDYTAIVLKKNGEFECGASNVTKKSNALSGGTEIVVEGAGDYSKYYITSETDVFYGKIVFKFSIGEDVEVKFNDVNITSGGNTAIKFEDVDKDNQKGSDAEEQGTGTGTIGSAVETAAPRVELSFTGTNSFKVSSGSGTNGTIYSECKLGIKGHGTADIDGGQSLSGICSTESVTVKNATLNIVSKSKQGISCDKKVTVNTGAEINIESMGDGIHCNKFEFNGSADGEEESTINIKSLYTTNCADGIDTDDSLIINGGRLNIVALTQGKYALKVRKVIKGNSKGIFEINGGSVTSAGSQNTPLKSCGQKTVLVTSSKAAVFTVGNVKSESCTSFVCSPVSVSSVTSSSGGTKNISWSSNKGTVSF